MRELRVYRSGVFGDGDITNYRDQLRSASVFNMILIRAFMGREPRERNSVRRERNVTEAWKQNVCGAIISHSLFETWAT